MTIKKLLFKFYENLCTSDEVFMFQKTFTIRNLSAVYGLNIEKKIKISFLSKLYEIQSKSNEVIKVSKNFNQISKTLNRN